MKWIEALNLCKIENQDYWMINPVGLILENSPRQKINFMGSGHEFFGFIDGSFLCQNDGTQRAGIGGFVKDKHEMLVFIFSGLTKPKDAFDAEWETCKFLLEKFWEGRWRHASILICSDNFTLIHLLAKMKAGLLDHDPTHANSFRDKVLNLKVSFQSILRVLNVGADDLAVRGRSNTKIIWSWCA
ncbi:hypothetical protein POM88_029574 [Heracleum sosnowskyi]|uniref:Uncharacterized protein n=1 Tax=Heracleum sosnowskyi TaxID=360622 RepID=A0AAD8MHA1_9APIA|nr:hypothetical protein POM88_029574 [Heracleum sosnowskyi]